LIVFLWQVLPHEKSIRIKGYLRAVQPCQEQLGCSFLRTLTAVIIIIPDKENGISAGTLFHQAARLKPLQARIIS
jgi:hypothetical protein